MSVNALKARIGKHDGLFSPNRFEVVFNPPAGMFGAGASRAFSGGNIILFTESLTLPGRQITTFEYPFEAVRQEVKVPNGYTNSDVECVFLLTNDFMVKKYFDEWVKAIITPDYLLNYTAQYETDVSISALDQKNVKRYTIKLLNAFPITVGDIALSNASTNEIGKLNVTFTYSDYEVVE